MKMKRFFLFFMVAFFAASPCFADNYSDTIQIFKKASNLQFYFSSAYGYAVFPSVGKGGIGIGGAYGKGQVYVGDKVTGTTSMKQLSIGLQLGGQAYRQIIFFKDKKAYDTFTSGSFEFGAEASAIAITASAGAKSGTTGSSAGAGVGTGTTQSGGSYVHGMTVFVDGIGGLMYEASISGQQFSFKPL